MLPRCRDHRDWDVHLISIVDQKLRKVGIFLLAFPGPSEPDFCRDFIPLEISRPWLVGSGGILVIRVGLRSRGLEFNYNLLQSFFKKPGHSKIC